MAVVTVGRPYWSGVHGKQGRELAVNGRSVGRIYPVGASGRARGWYVYCDSTPFQPVHWSATLTGAIAWAREWPDWPVQRWVAMNGEHGCLPDSWYCHESRSSAVESLVDLFALGNGRRARELRQYGYLELRLEDGAAYCEVTACTCTRCAQCSTGNSDRWVCPECEP